VLGTAGNAVSLNYLGGGTTYIGEGGGPTYIGNNGTGNAVVSINSTGAGATNIGANGGVTYIGSGGGNTILNGYNGGNVGIGTGSPGYKLDVGGSINATGDSYFKPNVSGNIYFMPVAGTSSTLIRNDGDATYWMCATGRGGFNGLRPFYIINATGQVGMDNGVSMRGSILLNNNTSDSGPVNINGGSGATNIGYGSGETYIGYGTGNVAIGGGNGAVYIKPSGSGNTNIGTGNTETYIGNTASGGAAVHINRYGSGATIINDNGAAAYIGGGGGNIYLNGNGTGNVGIRTYSPAYNLDVNGTARITNAPLDTAPIKYLTLDSTTNQIKYAPVTSGKYTPASSTYWANSPPTTIQSAVDRLAMNANLQIVASGPAPPALDYVSWLNGSDGLNVAGGGNWKDQTGLFTTGNSWGTLNPTLYTQNKYMGVKANWVDSYSPPSSTATYAFTGSRSFACCYIPESATSSPHIRMNHGANASYQQFGLFCIANTNSLYVGGYGIFSLASTTYVAGTSIMNCIGTYDATTKIITFYYNGKTFTSAVLPTAISTSAYKLYPFTDPQPNAGYTSSGSYGCSLMEAFWFNRVLSATEALNFTKYFNGKYAPLPPVSGYISRLIPDFGVSTSGANVSAWYDTQNVYNILGCWSFDICPYIANYRNGYAGILTTGSTSPPSPPASSSVSQYRYNFNTTKEFSLVSCFIVDNLTSPVRMTCGLSPNNNEFQFVSMGNFNGTQLPSNEFWGRSSSGVTYGPLSGTALFTAGAVNVMILTFKAGGNMTYNLNGTVYTLTAPSFSDYNLYFHPISEPGYSSSYYSWTSKNTAIMEHIVYSRAITLSEQTESIAYLNKKYSL
jgi:hypothetical protein